MTEGSLSGKVALVTGASKAIGKGIALELGACGATVYVTARTMGDPGGPDGGVASTAAEIDELGGRGVAIRCDHGDDAQVTAVFERIGSEQGQLDILVNNASPNFAPMVGKKFWEIPVENMDLCLDIGPRSAFVASSLAARMMIRRRSGLIVNVTSHGAQEYILSTPYGAGKAAIDKLTHDMALELREHGVAVVSLWPGWVKSERVMATAVTLPDGRMQSAGLDLSMGETPRFSGRAVAALFNDPDLLSRTGGAYQCSRLARDYGFTDLDGTLPPEVRGLRNFLGADNVPAFWKVVEPY